MYDLVCFLLYYFFNIWILHFFLSLMIDFLSSAEL